MANSVDTNPTQPSSRSRSISILVALSGILLSTIAGLFIAGVANVTQVFIVVFGLAAFVITFTRLDLGVAAMIFILYTQMYIIVGERYGITNVVQGLIMLLVLSMGTRWLVYTNELPQSWMKPLFLVTFYCMVGLTSVIYAEDPSSAMPVAVEMFKSGVIALIIAVVIRRESSLRMMVWALLSIGIILGSLSIFQFATGTYYNDYGGYAIASVQNISGQTNDYRSGGPVGDPNFYAQMMLVLVPLALDRVWNEKRGLFRLLAVVALGICAFTVLITYSRGGFLAMAIVVFAMIAVFHRGQLRYVIAVGALILLLINFLPSRFTERISTLTELFPSSSSSGGIAKDYSFRGRISEMVVAFQMFADHPIIGVGLGNYQVLYQKYSQRLGLDLRSEVRQAHSLYLEVASETGLFGIFSFFLLLWWTLRSIWRGQKLLAQHGLISASHIVAAYAFGFLGYLIAALFIHSAYPRNFWVLTGIALALHRVAEIEVEAAQKKKEKEMYGWRATALPNHS